MNRTLAKLLRLLLVLLVAMQVWAQTAGPTFPNPGKMGIQMGAQGLMMKYSRSDETQADSVGAMILYKAGYNPQGMVDFFQTMGSQGGSAPPEFFSSHPNPNNRQQAIQKQIETWPAQNSQADNANFVKIRQHATGVKAYTAAEIQHACC